VIENVVTQDESQGHAQDAAPVRGLSPALEPRLYLDPEVLELEHRAIFERTWQLAGHTADLPAVGSYITVQVGTQPILVVRDESGAVRAFRNVCRHRGSRLLSGSGQCKKAIRCRYHGWTYRLDGELIGVPEGRTIPDLDKATLGLIPARAEESMGLIFVNLDVDAQPLAEMLGDLPARVARYDIPNLQGFGVGENDQAANWKVVADNYLEGYHVPIAHPGLMRLLDYQRYDVELHEHWAWFEAPMRDKPSANRLERTYQRLARPMAGLEPQDADVWRYIFIYPNTTIDLYPDQVNTWRLRPDGVGVTRDTWATYRAANPTVVTRAAQWANNKLNSLVFDEDVDLVTNVQLGLATDGYRCGPLSQREAAVAWFADHVRASLGVDA